jgi:hypothetical protein
VYTTDSSLITGVTVVVALPSPSFFVLSALLQAMEKQAAASNKM